MKFLLAAGLLAILTACSSTKVITTVETHHQLDDGHAGQAVFITSADDEAVNSLQFKAHAKLVESGLQREGFKIAASPQEADVIAFFHYGIDGGRDEVYSYSLPQYGQAGVSGSQTYGSVTGGGNYNATTTYTPSYGVTGYSSHVGTRRVYARTAALDMFERCDPDGDWTLDGKIFEASMKSEGPTGTVSAVMDEIVEALFKNFRATGVRTEEVEMN